MSHGAPKTGTDSRRSNPTERGTSLTTTSPDFSLFESTLTLESTSCCIRQDRTQGSAAFQYAAAERDRTTENIAIPNISQDRPWICAGLKKRAILIAIQKVGN